MHGLNLGRTLRFRLDLLEAKAITRHFPPSILTRHPCNRGSLGIRPRPALPLALHLLRQNRDHHRTQSGLLLMPSSPLATMDKSNSRSRHRATKTSWETR